MKFIFWALIIGQISASILRQLNNIKSVSCKVWNLNCFCLWAFPSPLPHPSRLKALEGQGWASGLLTPSTQSISDERNHLLGCLPVALFLLQVHEPLWLPSTFFPSQTTQLSPPGEQPGVPFLLCLPTLCLLYPPPGTVRQCSGMTHSRLEHQPDWLWTHSSGRMCHVFIWQIYIDPQIDARGFSRC